MNYLISIFANNILPIFLAAGAGFLLAKYLKVSPRPVSQITFYLFSPALVYKLLTSNHYDNNELIRIVGFASLVVVVLGALIWLTGRFFRFERQILVAVVLAGMFGNLGNYGLSVNSFAFGEDALPYASLYFVISLVWMYTLGVILASLGSVGVGQAARELFKVPAVYALLLALIVSQVGWQPPLPVERTITILSEATIPTMMVLLGIQLYQSKWSRHILALSLASGMKLIISPLLAIGLSPIFGLSGNAYRTGVTQFAMPTAVIMTILATEYNVQPSFISAVVFTSMLLSPFTVTPILAFLGA